MKNIVCSTDGCDRPAEKKGYCSTHKYQMDKWGHTEEIRIYRPNGTTCSFPECGRPHWSKGLCQTHYRQKTRGLDLSPIQEQYARPKDYWVGKNCRIECCGEEPGVNGFCNNHRALRNWKNISDARWQDIFFTIDTVCAICGTDISGRDMHIDHDHSCHPGAYGCDNCVRGVLCRGCNTGLGCFRDDVEKMELAIKYLISRENELVL